jgi:hypothetical protein
MRAEEGVEPDGNHAAHCRAIISASFGIIIRIYYDEHNPSHLHAEFQKCEALLDFRGNIIK